MSRAREKAFQRQRKHTLSDWSKALHRPARNDSRDRSPSTDSSTGDCPTKTPPCNRCTRVHWAAARERTPCLAPCVALDRDARPTRNDPARHQWCSWRKSVCRKMQQITKYPHGKLLVDGSTMERFCTPHQTFLLALQQKWCSVSVTYYYLPRHRSSKES